MAKKKRKTSREAAGPGPGPDPGALDPSSLPDRRVLERGMRGLAAELGGGPAEDSDSPLHRAQMLMYEAFEADDRDEHVALARRALEISPDCADAYVVLAENAGSRKEALELYRKGVEAGRRAIGPDLFREGAGHFWGIVETRPFMRASLGLAEILWTLGKRAEAVGHLEEILRLNPNDNQGVRYTLAAWLLNLDRDADLARLLDQFQDEGSAAWSYTRALLAFRQYGDSPEARKRLQEAKKRNKHVPRFLLGQEPIPRQQPPYYSPGDPSEAILYTGTSLGAWKASPGSLTWLKDREKGTKKKRPANAKA